MKPLPGPDRWRVLAPLLEEALGLPQDRRVTFLDQACAGDPGLRREVEDLLSADSEASAFLGVPVDLSALALPADDLSRADAGTPGLEGTLIGPYRVVHEIGRGGMGVVYEAEQQRPRRPVALKVILGGRHVDAEAVRMFRRETDSLARLKHPSIAAIYESGSTDDGQHFFAMELVQGRTLSEYLEAGGAVTTRTELRVRLALFRKMTAAVAYAHQRGVIHRDLKPSNILVLPDPGTREPSAGGTVDDAPDIKVLDFGLARITDPDAEAATAVTEIGRIQGTLPYMSPEQVRGRRDDVDVRTDVYSLGVILYRMLTGRLPYDLQSAEFPEAARIICGQTPRPLRSAAGSKLKFDHDLEVIVLRALEKEPGRRYPTVAALDDDLGRYLAGQPILARPPSAAYQIRKLVARHKAPFAAAAVALIALLSFAIVATLQARRIAAERDRANREARTSLRVSNFLTDLFKVSDPDEARGSEIKAREILDTGVERIGKELADEPEIQARLMRTMGKVYANLGLYRKALPIIEQSVATRRRLLGEDNPETLAAMNDLAVLNLNLGRYADAEQLFEPIIASRRRLLGEEHHDTLYAMSGLANDYRLQGRYAEAEKVDRHLLDVQRRVLGDDDPDTIERTTFLASDYYGQRRYAEAEALLRPAVDKLRRGLGEDNSVTLSNAEVLATTHERQGHFAEAEALHRDTLERLRRVFGDDHPRTLEAENNLAVMFDDQERYAEAEPLFRDALDRRRRTLGEDHPSTITSMNNLANIYAVQGRYAEATALFREALEKDRRLLGEDHPDTTNTLYNLACLASLRHDRAAALDWLGRAVAHGYSHWDVMAKDSDLKSLRGDPAFEALVARARNNATTEASRPVAGR